MNTKRVPTIEKETAKRIRTLLGLQKSHQKLSEGDWVDVHSVLTGKISYSGRLTEIYNHGDFYSGTIVEADGTVHEGNGLGTTLKAEEDVVLNKTVEMYGWNAKDIIEELASCGLTNAQIGEAVKLMVYNDTFKMK